MTFDCMTDEELTLWKRAAVEVRHGASKPCADCPLAFHQAEKLAGRCNQPWRDGRPVNIEHRLAQQREAQKRYRDRHRAEHREYNRLRMQRLRAALQ